MGKKYSVMAQYLTGVTIFMAPKKFAGLDQTKNAIMIHRFTLLLPHYIYTRTCGFDAVTQH